jgi:anti-anti-sigma regulatory factor
VTLKIEIIPGAQGTKIRLIGRLRAEYLPQIRAQINASQPDIVLEMDEVTLVDVDAVRFLKVCESRGIQLRDCSPYIRKWMAQEQDVGPDDRADQ